LRQPNRRPFVRVYREHFLVVTLSIEVSEEHTGPQIGVVEVDLVVGRKFLISVHKHSRPLPFVEELEQRTATNPYLSGLPSTYLLYVLLDTIVGQYAREFDEVEDRVERLEEQLLRQPGRAALDEATLMKRHVLTLRRLVAPHREAFGVLAAADISLVRDAQVEIYFRDLVDHLDEFVDRLDHARDVLTGAFNLYLFKHQPPFEPGAAGADLPLGRAAADDRHHRPVWHQFRADGIPVLGAVLRHAGGHGRAGGSDARLHALATLALMDMGAALASDAAIWITLVFLAVFMAVTLFLAARQDDF
jgi:CorA-like Mg2+ transporter protein